MEKELEPKPIKYYAKALNVSERTLFSDLAKIEQYASYLGGKVIRKTGIGIELKMLRQKKTCKAGIEEAPEVMFGIDERRFQILERLLFKNLKITQAELSDFFLVSRTSIHSDLKYIKKTFLKFNCAKLVSDSKGTRLEGTEEEFQNTFISFNDGYLKKIEKSVSKDEQIDAFLKRHYGAELVDQCNSLLYAFIRENLNVIAEHYVFNLLNVLVVFVFRMQEGKHISAVTEAGMDKMWAIPMEKETNDIAAKLAKVFALTYTREDMHYLNKHLVANRLKTESNNLDYKPVVQEIVKKMSSTLNIDLTGNRRLIDQLSQHFPPMIYRLRNGLSIQNPFISQIKEDFGLMYNLTWFIMSDLETELDVHFNEHEMGFIMIYFQSAIDEAQLSKQVLIVCPTGMTTSELLSNRIRKILPPLDSIKVVALKQISSIDLEKIDFVISTVHMDVENVPVIVVSPLLNESDMQKVSQFYNSLFISKQNSTGHMKPHFDYLKHYLDHEFVFFESRYPSRHEIVKDLTDRLYKKNMVTEQYRQSILEREAAGGTDLPTGVAVPHGNPAFVKKTTICIAVNEKPVKWIEHHVRVVILICIAEQDMKNVKNILSEIYPLIDDKDFVEERFIHSTKEEFMQFIGGSSSD